MGATPSVKKAHELATGHKLAACSRAGGSQPGYGLAARSRVITSQLAAGLGARSDKFCSCLVPIGWSKITFLTEGIFQEWGKEGKYEVQ